MSPPDSVYAELARLRQRVAEIEAELDRRDRNSRAEVAEVMRATGLTIGQARMMVALATGKVLSRDQLAAMCCHDDCGDPRNVDSQVKRLRKRLPWLRVSSLYGVGYALDGDALGEARQFMKGGQHGQDENRLHRHPLQRDARRAGHRREGNPCMAQGPGLV